MAILLPPLPECWDYRHVIGLLKCFAKDEDVDAVGNLDLDHHRLH